MNNKSICPECSEEFTARAHNHKYCKNRCRNRAYERKQKYDYYVGTYLKFIGIYKNSNEQALTDLCNILKFKRIFRRSKII